MRLLFLQQWFSEDVLKAIGWTLIHSLWEGLLAAVLAGIIIICTKKSDARLRYNLLGAVLVLFMITTTVTFFQQLKESTVAERSFANLNVSVTETTIVSDNYETTSALAGTTINKFVRYFNTNADLFVLIWAIFFLFHCIKLVTGLAGVQRMCNYKAYASPDTWQTKLDQLRKLLGIKLSVDLLQSELVKVPVAIGFFKPVILVPFGLLSHLPPAQVETILLHELAHVRRKDYLVNILQRFTEVVFFFNPALLWISSLMRQEREACCDDIVVANTTNKGNYIEALVSFHEFSFPASGYAMAISSKRHYLLNRVKRMITRENKKLGIMEKLSLIIGLIAFTAFTFIPKKEMADKNNIAVTVPVKEQTASKPTIPVALSASVHTSKPAVKKKYDKPGLKVPMVAHGIDTVPAVEKRNDKTNYDDLKFPSVSSSINDDGKTKTENTTVTDQDGKKYTYTKLNNKITSLSIDGRVIPENEIDNYSSLFDKIETAMQENKAKRLKDIERRKDEMAQRTKDLKAKMVERTQQKESQNEKREYQNQKRESQNKKREYQNQQRENQNKKRDNQNQEREYQKTLKQNLLEKNKESKLLFEKSRKTSENQRKETRKLFEKIKRQKTNLPRINGREVIKNDIHVENSIAAGKLIKADLNKQPVLGLQEKLELKKTPDISLEKKLTKPHATGSLKPQVKLEVKRDLLLNDIDYKPAPLKWEVAPDELKSSLIIIEEKPARPIKFAHDGIKIFDKTLPPTPKSAPAIKMKSD